MTEETPPQIVICKNCGRTETRTDLRFCPNCGGTLVVTPYGNAEVSSGGGQTQAQQVRPASPPVTPPPVQPWANVPDAPRPVLRDQSPSWTPKVAKVGAGVAVGCVALTLWIVGAAFLIGVLLVIGLLLTCKGINP